MHTLLLQLAGPMQSWGTRSRFDERDTDLEPSKSGVIGLMCAALGIPRTDTKHTLELACMSMGVRVDREGVLRRDYQTAHSVSARGIISTVQTSRYYLADAVFLVGLESPELEILSEAHQALRNPVWSLALGRKSYVPSPGVWLADGLRENEPLKEALEQYPFLPAIEFELSETGLKAKIDQNRLPQVGFKHRCSLESLENIGSLRMDQPISNFAERRFGARFVRNTILIPSEVQRVSE
jgi:CRISPR system Cascade subunit CasD